MKTRDSGEPSSTSDSTQDFHVNKLVKSLFELELEVELKMQPECRFQPLEGSDANNSSNTNFEEVNHSTMRRVSVEFDVPIGVLLPGRCTIYFLQFQQRRYQYRAP